WLTHRTAGCGSSQARPDPTFPSMMAPHGKHLTRAPSTRSVLFPERLGGQPVREAVLRDSSRSSGGLLPCRQGSFLPAGSNLEIDDLGALRVHRYPERLLGEQARHGGEFDFAADCDARGRAIEANGDLGARTRADRHQQFLRSACRTALDHSAFECDRIALE